MDGFEIYLADRDLAEPLWDMIMSAGEKYNIAPGGPNQIDRIEGGLLGYGNEMTMDNNPLEMGFGKFCNLTGDIDCIGREALLNIQNANRNGIFAVSHSGTMPAQPVLPHGLSMLGQSRWGKSHLPYGHRA